MRGGVGELVGAGDVAAGVNIRHAGLQVFVHLDRAVVVEFHAQLFQPETARVRAAPERHQYFLQGNATLAPRASARRPVSPSTVSSAWRSSPPACSRIKTHSVFSLMNFLAL